VAIGIVAGVAVLVARDKPLIADDPVAPSPLAWPPVGELSADDLAGARFTVALRGYRIDEVDRVLADAQVALAERDRRIRALEGGDLPGHAPAGSGAGPDDGAALDEDPADADGAADTAEDRVTAEAVELARDAPDSAQEQGR
jgi:DivIVA domain-containing protein